jgi:hypothetical protein
VLLLDASAVHKSAQLIFHAWMAKHHLRIHLVDVPSIRLRGEVEPQTLHEHPFRATLIVDALQERHADSAQRRVHLTVARRVRRADDEPATAASSHGSCSSYLFVLFLSHQQNTAIECIQTVLSNSTSADTGRATQICVFFKSRIGQQRTAWLAAYNHISIIQFISVQFRCVPATGREAAAAEI